MRWFKNSIDSIMQIRPSLFIPVGTSELAENQMEFDKILSRVMPDAPSIIKLKRKETLVLDSSYCSTK